MFFDLDLQISNARTQLQKKNGDGVSELILLSVSTQEEEKEEWERWRVMTAKATGWDSRQEAELWAQWTGRPPLPESSGELASDGLVPVSMGLFIGNAEELTVLAIGAIKGHPSLAAFTASTAVLVAPTFPVPVSLSWVNCHSLSLHEWGHTELEGGSRRPRRPYFYALAG